MNRLPSSGTRLDVVGEMNSEAKPALPTHLGASGQPTQSLESDKVKASSTLMAGAAYCSVSAAMVLLNKYALSSFSFTCPNMLLLAQCVSSVVIVKLAELFGVWKVQPLRWDIVKVCIARSVSMQSACLLWSVECVERNTVRRILAAPCCCDSACTLLCAQ